MRISDWSSDVCSSDLSRMTSTMTANLQNLTHTTFLPIYANWHASCYIDDRYTEWGANLQPTLQTGWSTQPSGPCERSEERLVGKGGVSTVNYRWSRCP